LPTSVKKTRQTNKPRKTIPSNPFANLTWADLEDWAGSRIVSRGKNYQREGAVRELALTPEGSLVAWVKGARRYATQVQMGKSGRLGCECTCPFEGNCKHAVAVILEYLAFQKAGKAVPLVDEEDERLDILDDWVKENDFLEMEQEEEKKLKNNAAARNKEIENYLNGKSKDDLVKLVGDLRNRFPEISIALSDEIQLKAGRTKPLIDRIKREIREISSEPGWRNHWNDDGYTPDYSVIQKNLETLLAGGEADQVLSLGKALMKAGTQQVGMSHDDGETAMEIGSCLPVIINALGQSSMEPVDKLSWALETVLQDEYSLFEDLTEYLHRKHPAPAWNILADRLLERLRRFKPAPERSYEFSWKFDRDQLSNWIIHALERAGRKAEIIPLCEAEAGITGSHERLIRLLIDDGHLPKAEQWVFLGIKNLGTNLPGVTASLRKQLLEIRKREKDWSAVAALQVYEFVAGPSESTFSAAEKVLEKIKFWSTVRPRLLDYLETGALPWENSKWPLPPTKLDPPERGQHIRFPRFWELMDVAIYEKKPDQVIRWYDQNAKQAHGGYGGNEDRVAEAVKKDYPDRSVAIWKKIAEGEIAQVKSRAYQAAAVYLKKIARLLKERKRGKEWESYLNKLRQNHARKSSLIGILDTLEGKPILKT